MISKFRFPYYFVLFFLPETEPPTFLINNKKNGYKL